jgi:hypothetical protein
MSVLLPYLSPREAWKINNFIQIPTGATFTTLFLNNFTSKINGLTHSYDYIIPIDIWMEEVCEGINQPWHDLDLILHEYDLTLVPKLGVTNIPPYPPNV